MSVSSKVTTTSAPAQQPSTGTVGIIAGNGRLPYEIVTSLKRAGRGYFVIGLAGEVDDEVANHPHAIIEWGQIGRLFKILAKNDVDDVIFAGGILRRPELKLSKFDFGAFLTVPRVLAAMLAGDNAILSGVVGVFESRGFTVRGVGELAPDLLVTTGVNGHGTVSKNLLSLAEQGFNITRALGTYDVGQGCVLVGRRAVAIEGIEGTDEMLLRVARLKSAGRLPLHGGGVLVKCPKPGQDHRVDLPTIGPRTVGNAHAAGLTLIALEAATTVIVDREKTFEAAKQRGLVIYGAHHPADPETGRQSA